MRTLGWSKGKNAVMISLENLLTGVIGVLPGILLGYILMLHLFRLFQADMFTMYMVTYPRTYLITIVLVLLIIVISQVPSIRHLNRLDLAKVIKEQAI
jgi:putative ABC transport system permease protein